MNLFDLMDEYIRLAQNEPIDHAMILPLVKQIAAQVGDTFTHPVIVFHRGMNWIFVEDRTANWTLLTPATVVSTAQPTLGQFTMDDLQKGAHAA